MTDFSERRHWNTKYVADEAAKVEPDPLLVEACAGVHSGAALDLAGGAGRHALWLAKRDWRVTLADVSDEAIALARQRISEDSFSIAYRREAAADTVAWATGENLRFDLIAVFWFLERPLFPALTKLIAPNGLAVYKTFTSEHARFRRQERPAYALQPGELRGAFSELEVLTFREKDCRTGGSRRVNW